MYIVNVAALDYVNRELQETLSMSPMLGSLLHHL